MNCRRCGSEIGPTGACRLCGHNEQEAAARRRRLFWGWLKALFLIGTAIEIAFYLGHYTERSSAAKAALARMESSATVVQFLGKPIRILPGLTGEVTHDETGWKEARLTIPVRGPGGDAIAHVVGGRGSGPWTFTTFQVLIEKQHKKLDLVSGRVVDYDPGAYVDLHTQAAIPPEYFDDAPVPLPRMDGQFPCVFASVEVDAVVPHLGKCPMPAGHNQPVDRFEADLRYGRFVVRQTDLYMTDIFEVPLTRSYSSEDWLAEPIHAFGRNTNHSYDIAPRGTRNPYTFLMLVLEDGDLLYFPRISKGTGYADAVYRHSETSSKFYKATINWNGNGWTMRLADGEEVHFPESYAAKNLAQGAAMEMLDGKGNRLELRRDGRRNLQEIRTPHGHCIKFSYDDAYRIVRADDDAGHWARYEYNSDGMLVHVISSSGRERRYGYDKTLMTDITDEKDRVLLRNWYTPPGILIRQQFGDGSVFFYEYDWPENLHYSRTVTVRLPSGRSTEVQTADSVPDYVRNFQR